LVCFAPRDIPKSSREKIKCFIIIREFFSLVKIQFRFADFKNLPI